MGTGFYQSGEIKPAALGALMAEIACSKVFDSWDKDAEISEKVKAVKACKENARYLLIFEALLKDAPKDSKTTEALSELIGKLKKYEQAYLTSHRVICI